MRADEQKHQGGPLPPLLSNILLDELDNKLTYKQQKFARYADDIIILVKTKNEKRKTKNEKRKTKG
ncbi:MULTISPECIES: reverse transcriptase domain-containing protein [Pseudoalteromonas]|uniref:reverse transcriptase domain-containing protein n=1 Tax=Pseudoalteromonas TaxID=53246 RepID=UPI0003010EFF|nr:MULTISPECIES: reverse transcriptase domain-containing protein [Pseudoalteromonas]MCF6143518.1 hypothetical protein [Pseudoalteromonas mariniglutinosa NCIMB 1770]